MAHERDYENIHDIDQMEDRELRDLVREQLSGQSAIDADNITVTVKDGLVTLAGRIGTDGERRVAEHTLTDVLGVSRFANNLVVDAIRRDESADAVDEERADEASRSGTLLGEVDISLSDESGHLADRAHDDLGGTTNYQEVMEEGMTWNPPDSPTPEGLGRGDSGGDESRSPS